MNLPEDNWKLAEELKKTPGLENLEIPPTAVCPVLLFDTDVDTCKENSEPLCEKFAEMIKSSPEKTTALMEPSGKNVLAKFVMTDPDSHVKFEVENGDVPSNFREALSDDENLSRVFPNQKNQPRAISISGLSFSVANDNTADLQDNLTQACGCMDSDIDITQLIETKNSTVVCYTKPCNGSLTEDERAEMEKLLAVPGVMEPNVGGGSLDPVGGAAMTDDSSDKDPGEGGAGAAGDGEENIRAAENAAGDGEENVQAAENSAGDGEENVQAPGIAGETPAALDVKSPAAPEHKVEIPKVPQKAYEVADATTWDFLVFNAFCDDVEPIQENLMEKLTQLLDVNSDNIGLTCMQGENDDHVTCRFAIAEPSDEVRAKLNPELAQKLRQMINEDKSLEGLPSQESNNGCICMLNIDKAGLEPLIDAVKEAIAKALGINPEDMEILSTNDTPLGVLVEFTKPLASAVDVELIEEDIHHIPEFEEVALADVGKVYVLLYGMTPEDVEKNNDRFTTVMAQLLDIMSNQIAITAEPRGNNTTAQFVVIYPDEETLAKCYSPDIPPAFRKAIDDAHDINVADQSSEKTSVAMKNIDLNSSNPDTIKKALAESLGVDEDAVEVDDIFETDDGVVVNYTKPKAAMTNHRGLLRAMTTENVAPASVDDTAICDVVLYHTTQDAVTPVGKLMGAKAAEILGVDPEDVSVAYVDQDDNVIVKIVVNKPTKEVKEACKTLAPKLRALIAADPELSKLVGDQSKDMGSLLLKADMDTVKANQDELIEAIADACGVPPSEINITDIQETSAGVIVSFEKPKCTAIDKDDLKTVLYAIGKGLESGEEVALSEVCLYDVSKRKAKKKEKPMRKIMGSILEMEPESIIVDLIADKPDTRAVFILLNPQGKQKAMVNSGEIPFKFRTLLNADLDVSRSFPDQLGESTAVCVNGVEEGLLKSPTNQAIMRHFLAHSATIPRNKIDVAKIWDTDGGLVVQFVHPSRIHFTEDQKSNFATSVQKGDGFEDCIITDAAIITNFTLHTTKPKKDHTPECLQTSFARVFDMEPEDILVECTRCRKTDTDVTYVISNGSPDIQEHWRQENGPEKIRRQLAWEPKAKEKIPDQTQMTSVCILHPLPSLESVDENAMQSSIAKARKIPNDLIELGGIYTTANNSPKGVVVEYKHAKALPQHNRRELEFNVRKSLGSSDLNVDDGILIEFMLYGKSTKDAKNMLPKLSKAFCQNFKIKPENLMTLAGPRYRDGVTLKFIVMNTNIRVDDFPERFRDYVVSEELVSGQELSPAMVCVKNVNPDLMFENVPEIHHSLRRCHEGNPDVKFSENDIHVTPTCVFLGMKKSNSVDVVNNLRPILSRNIGFKNAEVLDACQCRISVDPSYILDNDAFTDKLKEIVTSLIALPPKDITVKFLSKKAKPERMMTSEDLLKEADKQPLNQDIEIFLVAPTSTMQEDCASGELAEKIMDELKPAMKTEYVTLKGTTVEDLENNEKAVIQALAKASNLPENAIDVNSMTRSGSAVVLAFDHPDVDDFSEDFQNDLPLALGEAAGIAVTTYETAQFKLALFNMKKEDAEEIVPLLVKALAQILQVPPESISTMVVEDGDHCSVTFFIEHPSVEVKSMCAASEPEGPLRNYMKFDPEMKEKSVPNQELTPAALRLDGATKAQVQRNLPVLEEAVAASMGIPKVTISSVEETPNGLIIYFMRPSDMPFEADQRPALVAALQATPLSMAKILICSVFDFTVFGKQTPDLEPGQEKFMKVFTEVVQPDGPSLCQLKDVSSDKALLRFVAVDSKAVVSGAELRAAFLADPELRELLMSHFINYTIPLVGVDAEVMKIYLSEMIPYIAKTFQVHESEVKDLMCEATDSGCVVKFTIPQTDSAPPRGLLIPVLFSEHPKMFALINKKAASADIISTTLVFKGVDHKALEPHEGEFRTAISDALDVGEGKIMDISFAQEADAANVMFSVKRSPVVSKMFTGLNVNEHLKKQPNVGPILFPPRTFTTGITIPNASKADMEANLDALKAAMALALGVDEDQIQSVSLLESENGVTINFVINQGENGENIAKMSSGFNFLEAAKEVPALSFMAPKKQVPKVSIQISLQNVDPDDIELLQLKESLAKALGGEFKPSDIDLKLEKDANGNVVITVIFPQSEMAISRLQDPTFDLKKELAKNPQLKFFANLTRFSYPFPVLKPDELAPYKAEIQKAISVVTNAPLDSIIIEKMEGDYTGSVLSFAFLEISDASRTAITDPKFSNNLFKQFWLYPGLFNILLSNNVVADFHFLLANATKDDGKKVEADLLKVLCAALGLNEDSIAIKYEPFGDHMIMKFMFKFSQATQKILQDSDLGPKMLDAVVQKKDIPNQARTTTSIVLVGVLLSEIEENRRELFKRFSQAALLPVGLIELIDMKEISEGTVVTLRHPESCPFDSDVLDAIALALKGSKKFNNDQVEIDARFQAQYTFVFKQVPPEKSQLLAETLCKAFALALGVDPKHISILMLQGKDAGSEIMFGIHAGCLEEDHITKMGDIEAFNEVIALQFEAQDDIVALLKELGLIGSTLGIQIYFNVTDVKELDPHHDKLKIAFAEVAGVTPQDVIISAAALPKVEPSGAEEEVQSADQGINILLDSLGVSINMSTDKIVNEPRLDFAVTDTPNSREALKDPEEFDRKFKEKLGTMDPLGKLLGLTMTYVPKEVTVNKVTPEKIDPYRSRICVALTSLCDVDPDSARIIEIMETPANTVIHFEVIENPRTVMQLNNPDFNARLMELLAKIQGLNELLGLVWKEPQKFTSGGHGSGSCANLSKKIDNSDSCFAIVHMRVAPEQDQSNFRVVPIMVRFEGKDSSDVSKERCRYLFNDARDTSGEINGVIDLKNTKKCSSAHIMNSLPEVFEKHEVDIDDKGKKKKRKRTRGAAGARTPGPSKREAEETDSRVKEILKILRSDIGWVNWALFKCSGKKLELASRDSFGSGTIFAMKEYLKDKEVYFGLLRMSFGTQPYRRSWTVMFHWA